jgi:CTP synthase
MQMQRPAQESHNKQITMFCQVGPEQVIAVYNVSSNYSVRLLSEKQGLIPTIRDTLRLGLVPKAPGARFTRSNMS